MRASYFGLIMATFFLTGHAFGGYGDLKKSYEAYEPPSYYRSQLKTPEPAREAAKLEDPAFSEAGKKIAAAAVGWEEALAIDRLEDPFFRPRAPLFSTLESAQKDPQAAAAALGRKFSRETLSTLVLLRNPGIKAAENKFRAALQTYSQVSNLDDILRRYTAFTEAVMTGVGPMKGKEPIDMKFPFPGVLALKGEVVNQAVKAERENLEIARRDSVTEARRAYWELLYVGRSQAITAETTGLLRHLESVAETRYRAGKTSFQDVIKIRIKRQLLEEEIVTLRERASNLKTKIRELVDLPPETAIGVPEAGPPQVAQSPKPDPLYRSALEKRQELRRTRAMIGKAERMIEMAETMILPDFSLNFSLYEDDAALQVGSTAMKNTFPVTTEASRGAGLPKTPWYGTEDAYLRQTRQNLAALREQLRKAENDTVTMVRNNWFALDKAIREEALFRKSITGLAQSALDVSGRAYEAGSISFADVIDSYMSWLDAKLALDRKQSDVGIAWAELEKTVGVTLKIDR